ncbi:EAL domain-containing protein [Martelella radicis]|uniref:cyclic-guanylate-specific phosphodiesterase n=1 Tax=Martelella radicis TaxID=1397476 RepID=A0A7W6KNX8_9HYPH|nr:EAL domain-containing protein [Martelella radicis]MBB4123529.1 sensor c-di-GMP phosphodiesterase-like protein [Martelella radicis]
MARLRRGRAVEVGRRNIWIIGLVWAFVGGICSLLIAEFFQNHTADEYVDYYGSDVFRNAVSVAETGLTVLGTLDQSPDEPCSASDVEAMRSIVFSVPFLADVGRLQDGKLVCTGIWGELAAPVTMPPRSKVIAVNGTILWKATDGIVPAGLTADMASFGNSVVMTEPSAFARYEHPESRLAALVLTHDGSHIFQSFGETEGLPQLLGQKSDWYRLARRRVYSRCNDHVDVCVVAAYNAPPMFRAAPFDFLLVLAGGVAVGGGIGLWHARLYRESLSWRYKLQRALDDDRLIVHYQPIVRLTDNTLRGAEALVRLVDFDGTMIPPDQFIPAAETCGFIRQITRSVVRQTLLDMAAHLSADSSFYVSINVAAEDILSPDFLLFLKSETEDYGIAAGQVALELTERSTASHDRLTEAMEAFNRRGYKILIDDFGTGYSNLAYIARMPITGIKVDRMFTQALDQQAIGGVIVSKVCEIAEALDVTLICEGVETREQAATLLAIYPEVCAQGFLIGRPMPAEAFSHAFPAASHAEGV